MRCPSCLSKVVTEKQDYIGKSKVFQEKKLFECKSCQLVFASPAPTQKALSHYYKTYWDGEVAIVSASTERYYLAQSISRIHYIKSYVNFKKKLRVLDVGAGAGTMADALKKENIKCNYNAVEPDNTQRNNLTKNPNTFNIYSDLNKIPNQNKFDLIILSHVLEHVLYPHDFINKLTNLLDPKGYLFIEIPNEDFKHKHIVEPHLLFFNYTSLLKCIKEHGKVINICSVGKEITNIKTAKSHPVKSSGISLIKELAKTLLAIIDKGYISKQILKYQMSDYGDNRQWLRAIIKKY